MLGCCSLTQVGCAENSLPTGPTFCTPFGRDACVPAALHDAAAMLRDGKTVLVHCKRGRHRTGAFLGILKACAT